MRPSRLLWLALTLPLDGAPVLAQAPRAAGDLTIVLAGDAGFGSDPRGSAKAGVFYAYPDPTAPIAREIDGDLNLVNVETVVSDRSDLAADGKGQTRPFNFRMHPAGLRHLVSRGFNLLSLANNHSMDFGTPGLKETLRHVDALRGKGVLAAAGIGMTRDEAAQPALVEIKGAKIAFGAIGIVTNNLERHRAGASQPGQIAYRFDDDFREVLRRLHEAPAAFRILSIHYGYEGKVRADSLQLAQWRGEAAQRTGIDLIVGHHAHVARGVEMAGKSLIFYGLGNFLHHGTADMTANPVCKEYGLMARVHLKREASGALAIRAVEVLPLTDTHVRVRRLPADQAALRVHVLNHLASTLDDKAGTARGLRFTPQKDGSGLYCVPGAASDGGRIGRLCKGFTEPPPIPEPRRKDIEIACAQ
ncbi:MAG: CapA family protein [Pseudorhodoplanes sp.]|nr:CapA family protein [Pseudorhodoplanes sp.]